MLENAGRSMNGAKTEFGRFSTELERILGSEVEFAEEPGVDWSLRLTVFTGWNSKIPANWHSSCNEFPLGAKKGSHLL